MLGEKPWSIRIRIRIKSHGEIKQLISFHECRTSKGIMTKEMEMEME